MSIPAPSAVMGLTDLNSGQRVDKIWIEETNKVRAKLGLKPLQIDGAKNADGTMQVLKKLEDVHVPLVYIPLVNISEVKQTQLLKEKFETRKRKQQMQKKLSKVKPLAAGSDDEVWAERPRREAHQKAVERERLQVEQDAVEEKEDVRRQPLYTVNDLKGLKVEHNMKKFQERWEIILTQGFRCFRQGDKRRTGQYCS